jgi:hypothetical protein
MKPFERFLLAADHEKPLETVQGSFREILITGLKPRC